MELTPITSATYQKISIFQTDRMARLFLEVLQNYRDQGRFLLHEFVLMPDHFHLLLTPAETLEKAVQKPAPQGRKRKAPDVSPG